MTYLTKEQLTSLKNTELVFRAINHKGRQRIIDYIHKNPDTTVTKLYCHLRLNQSMTSQHLSVLRKAGIIKSEKEGKFRCYSINHDVVKMMIGFRYQLNVVS